MVLFVLFPSAAKWGFGSHPSVSNFQTCVLFEAQAEEEAEADAKGSGRDRGSNDFINTF